MNVIVLNQKMQALKSALLAQNWKEVGEMRYQLGLLHLKLKKYDKALEYITEFHKYCEEVKDLVKITI